MVLLPQKHLLPPDRQFTVGSQLGGQIVNTWSPRADQDIPLMAFWASDRDCPYQCSQVTRTSRAVSADKGAAILTDGA